MSHLKSTLIIILRIILMVLLTITTQIGGVIYLIAVVFVKKSLKNCGQKRLMVFLVLYLIATFLIVPRLAPVFGREKIEDTDFLQAQSFIYKLANRNYVRPELNQSLKTIAARFSTENDFIKVIYLDANFPFLDKFPLLPHLSHNDGKKIDVSLIYQDKEAQLTHRKRSRSGYGIYEEPTDLEYHQNEVCQQNGNWHYDLPKYLTLGSINDDIKFSKEGTKNLIQLIVKEQGVGKLFIEPHLKTRMQLNNDKIRFHGCHAVRHDDHIHFQMRN